MTDTLNSLRPDEPLSFESALARIETIVHELEEGQTGLAESLNRYEEGVRLLRQCYGLLEKAERRIELLVGSDAAGNPVTEPFDDTASIEREQQGAPRSRRRSAAAAKAAPATPIEPAEPRAGASGVDAPGGLF
jgi:exodeoxyribonuclease VII small subunit